MKVPISTTQSCNTGTGKPLSCDNSALNTAFHGLNSVPNTNNNLSYEPTSVLELQSSPTSVASTTAPPPSDAASNNHLPSVDLDNLEGWDSFLSDLGLNDDSTPNSKLLYQISPCDSHLPNFPSCQPSDFNFFDLSYAQNPNPNFGPFDPPPHHQPDLGVDILDDLVRAAQSFESNDSHQVQLILARLNQRLRSPVGKPLQRAAFYFKEALQHLTTTETTARPTRLSSYDIVQTIRAYKAFSGISPVPLFSTFAANQVILEAVDGSAFIHVVDFDIGFGGHWASFMRELFDKNDPSRINSVVLRVTAIVPDEFGTEGKLVRENLTQFAGDLKINFHIEFVLLRSFEILSFKSVKFMTGEKLAVHLSPAVFHRLNTGISKFLADLRGISPISVVVVVDREVGIDAGSSSFSVNFASAMEFNARMMESLDVAAAGGFVGGEDCVRRIEKFVLRPKIMAAVDAAATVVAGGWRTAWREAFVRAGMRAVGFSQFADFQGECLLRRAHVAGFRVAKRHGEMILCWHDRSLVAISAWRC